jgi:hypothetical protein
MTPGDVRAKQAAHRLERTECTETSARRLSRVLTVSPLPITVSDGD